MKVMLLTSEGFDTPNSINHLLITLSEDILRAGNELYLVSSHKTGTYPDTPPILAKYSGFSHSVIMRKSIDKNHFIKRYLDEVLFAFSAFSVWIKKKGKTDAVILQSNPLSVLHAVMVHSFLKSPIILNLYDVFPGHADKIGVINNPLVYKTLRWLQRILYKACSRIVVMSEDMRDVLTKESVAPEKVIVINNWYDDEIFKAIPRNENKFLKKYQLSEGTFYVQFAGLLGYVFDDQTFLNVAEKLTECPDIKFLLIGDGNQKERILSEIKSRDINNVSYFPWQPLDIINDVYNACDIGFIPLKDGVIGNGIPSKACQLMALGKVIVNSVENSDYTKLFDDYEMGVNVTNKDPVEIAQAIIMLSQEPELCKELGENAQRYSKDHYSRSANTKKFVGLISDCDILANETRK